MEMDFIGAFELEYGMMVDFRRIIEVHPIRSGTLVLTLSPYPKLVSLRITHLIIFICLAFIRVYDTTVLTV